MIIRVRDIPSEGREFDFKIKNSSIENLVELPEVKVNVHVENRTVQLDGNVKGIVNIDCSRCGEEFRLELEAPIQMFLKPSDPKQSNFKLEEDVGYGLYDGHEFECSEIANEALVLAIPFAPLCSEKCLGICFECNSNLNLEKCKCKPEI